MRRAAGWFLLLAACGVSPSGAQEQNAGGELRLKWNRGVGAFTEWLRPARAGDVVCAVNARGLAFFLNPETGGDVFPPVQIFKTRRKIAGAGCGGRTIAAAQEDGVLAAFDMGGEELWRKDGEGGIASPPLVSGGAVFILRHGGRLNAYSARRGALLWRFVSPLESRLRTRLDSSPAAFGGLVYADAGNGAVAAVRSQNGRLKWISRMAEARAANSFSNILNMTTPAARGGVVCAAAHHGHVGCADAEEGTVLWRKPFSAVRRAAVDIGGARVFAVSDGGEVRAYSARDGKFLWKRQTEDATVAAFVRGAVIVGFRRGKIEAWSPEDGSFLSSVGISGGVTHLEPLDENSVLGATFSGGIFRAAFGGGK